MKTEIIQVPAIIVDKKIDDVACVRNAKPRFQNTNAKRGKRGKRGRGEYRHQNVYQNIMYFDTRNQPKSKGKRKEQNINKKHTNAILFQEVIHFANTR